MENAMLYVGVGAAGLAAVIAIMNMFMGKKHVPKQNEEVPVDFSSTPKATQCCASSEPVEESASVSCCSEASAEVTSGISYGGAENPEDAPHS